MAGPFCKKKGRALRYASLVILDAVTVLIFKGINGVFIVLIVFQIDVAFTRFISAGGFSGWVRVNLFDLIALFSREIIDIEPPRICRRPVYKSYAAISSVSRAA